MGKDWHWGGGRSTKKAGGSGGGGGATTISYGGDKENTSTATTTTTTTTTGCMGAVLQFFDFHQFQLPLHHPQPPLKPQSFLPEDPTLLKGVEAPRNSLESEDSSLSPVSKEEENLNIPVGIQIKTSSELKLKVGATNDLSSESSCSPATRTPNLVARLMGLDLLPDHDIPSPSSSSHQFHHLQPPNSKRQPLQHRPSCHHHHRCFLDTDVIGGTRSLPETPRLSAARRSDVDHRLSLQINKENIGAGEELDLSRILSRRSKEMGVKHESENISPSYYARQIVKKVKDNVGRRVGMDITNTVKLRDHHHENPSPYKSRKNPKARIRSSGDDQFSPTCSPRLRFLETKTKPVSPSSSSSSTSTKDQKPHSPKPLSPLSSSSSPSINDNHNSQTAKISSKTKVNPLLLNQQQQKQTTMKKCKNPTRQNFGTRLKKSPKTADTIRNKQEEPFVRPPTAKNSNHPDKKCKKTPLSTDLLSITVPTLVPFKKEQSSSPPATEIPQKQVHGVQSSKCSISLSSWETPKYGGGGGGGEEEEAAAVAVAARHNKLAAQEEGNEEKTMTATTTTTTTQVQGAAAEFQYISRILKRTGIDSDIPESSTQFFLPPSSPLPQLHSSIFHQVENEKEKGFPATNPHPANPMLIFDLVNEFLPEILKPQERMKNDYHGYDEMMGGEVLEKMWERIRSIRWWKCEVLEDIDGMVSEELPEWKMRRRRRRRGYEEEEVAAEIEREIMEELVAEATLDYGEGFRTETARVREGGEYITILRNRVQHMGPGRC